MCYTYKIIEIIRSLQQSTKKLIFCVSRYSGGLDVLVTHKFNHNKFIFYLSFFAKSVSSMRDGLCDIIYARW